MIFSFKNKIAPSLRNCTLLVVDARDIGRLLKAPTSLSVMTGGTLLVVHHLGKDYNKAYEVPVLSRRCLMLSSISGARVTAER